MSIDSSYQRIDSVKLKQPVLNAKGSMANDSSGWSVYRPKNLKFSADQLKLSSIWSTRFPRDYVIVFQTRMVIVQIN